MAPTRRSTLVAFASAIVCLPGSSAVSIKRQLVSDPATFAATTYDFVVVGGGTAGLAVAARLAEVSSFTVGVIEAGQYRPNDPIIDVPKNFGTAVGNANYDWIYATSPQTNVNGRSIRHPRGKVLGGSSAINFEIFNRPAKQEYTAWSALNLGQGSWDWNNLLSYFKKSETYTPPRPEDAFPSPSPSKRDSSALRKRQELSDIVQEYFDQVDQGLEDTPVSVDDLVGAALEDSELTKRNPAYHGSTGPLKISHNEWYSDIAEPFILTMNSLGIQTNTEPDSGNNVGIYNSPAAVDREAGVRSYAAPAYFAPNSAKPNLVVLTGAQATKVNFSSTKKNNNVVATSVDFVSNGVSYNVKAKKEVILSGGVFNTPQLLELSGIGDSDLLTSLGITPLVDLPGVGENLQDHAMIPVSFTLNEGHHTWDQLRNNATFAAEAAARYAATKDGILASNLGVLSFFPLQSFLSGSTIQSKVSNLVSELVSNWGGQSKLRLAQNVVQLAWLQNQNIPQVEFVMGPGFSPSGTVTVPSPGVSYLSITAVLQHPFSRGSVHITSNNPLSKPTIDPNYLSVSFDKEILLEAIKYIRNLATIAPLSTHIAAPNDPPASWTTDAQYEEYLKRGMESLKHPVGTAAMSPRQLGGVVSERLLVHGTANLRVVDASIFPMHVSAHAQSTTYVIGEKAADIIKAAY